MDQTGILNMALHHLGIEPILSIDDLNPAAKVLKDFWVPARDDTYSEHRWPFADVQLALELVSGVTVIGWDYVYGYPVNVARVWNVYSEGQVAYKEEREFEKKYSPAYERSIICSNDDYAYADVTYIIENVDLWDPKFCMAHSLKMASLACPDLVGDGDKALQLMQLYTGVINEAKRIGSVEQKKKPNQNSSDGTINSRG